MNRRSFFASLLGLPLAAKAESRPTFTFGEILAGKVKVPEKPALPIEVTAGPDAPDLCILSTDAICSQIERACARKGSKIQRVSVYLSQWFKEITGNKIGGQVNFEIELEPDRESLILAGKGKYPKLSTEWLMTEKREDIALEG